MIRIHNWQETDTSRKVQEGLDPDFVLLESYYEFPTYRYLVSVKLLHGKLLYILMMFIY